MARRDSSRDGPGGYCGICTEILQMRLGVNSLALSCTAVVSGLWYLKCCCQSLVSHLTQLGSLCFCPHFFFIKCCYTPLTEEPFGPLVFLLPWPRQSVAGVLFWGLSVHTHHNFLGTNHVLYCLHFLYFNKNVNEKYPSGCLGSKTLKFRTRREVWCS